MFVELDGLKLKGEYKGRKWRDFTVEAFGASPVAMLGVGGGNNLFNRMCQGLQFQFDSFYCIKVLD